MENEVHLFFDDTGLRKPKPAGEKRVDNMDCFGLGGFLVHGEDIDVVKSAHKTFCDQWNISYPLHSNSIRGTQ